MSVIITSNGVLGPFKKITALNDRLQCDQQDIPFIVIGSYSISEDDSLAPVPVVDTTGMEAEARTERNRLLSESDWTQIADATVDKAAWATYRQALRDLPQQAGFPTTINWPVKPE